MSLRFGPIETRCLHDLTQTTVVIGVHAECEGVAQKTGAQRDALTLGGRPGIQRVASPRRIPDRVVEIAIGHVGRPRLPRRIHEDVHAFLAGRGHAAHHHGQHGPEI